jgi:hypothetical protein
MSNSLQLTVRENKKDGTFEGIGQLEGGTQFKLTKCRSEDTRFTTRSSLTQSARTFAKRFGLELSVATSATKPKSKSKTTTNCKTAIKSNRTTAKALANDSDIS